MYTSSISNFVTGHMSLFDASQNWERITNYLKKKKNFINEPISVTSRHDF